MSNLDLYLLNGWKKSESDGSWIVLKKLSSKHKFQTKKLCHICLQEFDRLDRLKTHISSHEKSEEPGIQQLMTKRKIKVTIEFNIKFTSEFDR